MTNYIIPFFLKDGNTAILSNITPSFKFHKKCSFHYKLINSLEFELYLFKCFKQKKRIELYTVKVHVPLHFYKLTSDDKSIFILPYTGILFFRKFKPVLKTDMVFSQTLKVFWKEILL